MRSYGLLDGSRKRCVQRMMVYDAKADQSQSRQSVLAIRFRYRRRPGRGLSVGPGRLSACSLPMCCCEAGHRGFATLYTPCTAAARRKCLMHGRYSVDVASTQGVCARASVVCVCVCFVLVYECVYACVPQPLSFNSLSRRAGRKC